MAATVDHSVEQEHLLLSGEHEIGKGEKLKKQSHLQCLTLMVIHLLPFYYLPTYIILICSVVTKGVISEAEARELFRMYENYIISHSQFS